MGALLSLIAVAVLALVAAVGGSVDALRSWFGVIIPGLAFVVFVVFVVYRVVLWARSPVPFRIPTTTGQQKTLPWIKSEELESPSGLLGALGRMAMEILFFRSLFRNTRSDVLADKQKVTFTSSKLLWFAAILFHWSMLVIVFRHLRLFLEPVPSCVTLVQSLDGFFQIGVPELYATTVLFLLGLVLLLGRRLFDAKLRYISLPSDYLALYLLLGIGASGALMRHIDKVDIVQVKAAIAGLFSLQLHTPTQTGVMYFVHVTLVSALLVYLPFSKLLHMPGVFFSPTRNLANNNRQRRHINPWNPDIVGHTYAEWQAEFRDKLVAAGYELDEE